jgi:hypothetical protein
VTRETAAINAVRAESEAAERLVPPPQNPYWDLDLLTPDDVCALLKVKRAGSMTPWRMAQSRPSGWASNSDSAHQRSSVT